MRSVSVHLPPARRVLDFGCGTAWLLAEAQLQGPCTRVGIDYATDSVRLGKQQYPDIAFSVADGLNLPFAEATFDVVMGHVSMPYMNTSKGLREIFRVLRPGGSLFLTFHSFFYVRQRFWNSVRLGNWKDILFCGYMAFNGLLNYLALPQIHAPWRRSRFETVNNHVGVSCAARREGFILVSAEHEPLRIFFALTARKPDQVANAVLPAPAWSAYCRLSSGPAFEGLLAKASSVTD